jgi:muramidase (phage lysozyme)
MRLSKKGKIYLIISSVILLAGIYAVVWIKWIRKINNKMNGNDNVKAFLMMIRHAEGTAGANGYRTLFGGKLFNDYAQHPRVKVPFRNTYSTAAGAYQFLYSTWYRLSLKLGLKDFSPESQDKACIELIREKNALEDVKNGNFESAIKKIAKV